MTIIPVIAGYFEISLDILFNYNLKRWRTTFGISLITHMNISFLSRKKYAETLKTALNDYPGNEALRKKKLSCGIILPTSIFRKQWSATTKRLPSLNFSWIGGTTVKDNICRTVCRLSTGAFTSVSPRVINIYAISPNVKERLKKLISLYQLRVMISTKSAMTTWDISTNTW